MTAAGGDDPAGDPWHDFEVCPTEPATEVAPGFVAAKSGTRCLLLSPSESPIIKRFIQPLVRSAAHTVRRLGIKLN